MNPRILEWMAGAVVAFLIMLWLLKNNGDSQ